MRHGKHWREYIFHLLNGIYLTSRRVNQWAKVPRIVVRRGSSCLDNSSHYSSSTPSVDLLVKLLISYLKFEIPFPWGFSLLLLLDPLSFLCIYINCMHDGDLLRSFGIIGDHWKSWRIIRVCSHLTNIEGILLKLKIDAVVESLDGPPLLLHHHQHNLTAPPADISHHSEWCLLVPEVNEIIRICSCGLTVCCFASTQGLAKLKGSHCMTATPVGPSISHLC